MHWRLVLDAFSIGSREIPNWFPRHSRLVPEGFPIGSRGILDWFSTHSRLVPERFPIGSRRIPNWFPRHSRLVLAAFSIGSRGILDCFPMYLWLVPEVFVIGHFHDDVFDYKYQNALRQAIAFGICSFVKNRSCVTQICITKTAAKCILVVVVEWRHRADVLLVPQLFAMRLSQASRGLRHDFIAFILIG